MNETVVNDKVIVEKFMHTNVYCLNQSVVFEIINQIQENVNAIEG